MSYLNVILFKEICKQIGVSQDLLKHWIRSRNFPEPLKSFLNYLFQVDSYLCCGTPNDLKTFNYWQTFFHKWKDYIYTLKNYNTIENKLIPEIELSINRDANFYKLAK